MIELSRVDKGDEANYAFRHPNILDLSFNLMLMPINGEVVAGFDPHVGPQGYGAAFLKVSHQWKRGRRLTPGDHAPTQWFEATPEKLMSFDLVRRIIEGEILFSHMAPKGVMDVVRRYFDLMVFAEDFPERVGKLTAERRLQASPIKPFSDYLLIREKEKISEIEEQARWAFEQEETIQMQADQMRITVSPDWGHLVGDQRCMATRLSRTRTCRAMATSSIAPRSGATPHSSLAGSCAAST